MSISDLIYGINNIDLKKILPMSKVKTNKDAEMYRSKGYYIPITYNEFVKKHTKIVNELDINKFYYITKFKKIK